MLELLKYDFFLNALAASFFSGICCGIIGVYIVSRRIVFISGGISHASFGGIGIAYYYGLNPIISASIFAVLSGFSTQYFSDLMEKRVDNIIGIVWSVGMAVGIIFISLSPGYNSDLLSYLFGDILTVSKVGVWSLVILSLLLIFITVSFFKEILLVSYDEYYAKSQGVAVQFINYLMIGITSLTIVFVIKITGIILVMAMLTIPQALAAQFTNKFKNRIYYSVFFSIISSIMGLFISFNFKIPSGALIIVILSLILIMTILIKKIKNKLFNMLR